MNEEGLINCHLERIVKDASISKGVFIYSLEILQKILSLVFISAGDRPCDQRATASRTGRRQQLSVGGGGCTWPWATPWET